MNPVIIFYSNSGNTAALAYSVHEFFGGERLEIEPKEIYGMPSEAKKRVKRERKNGVIAEYSAPEADLKDVDVVFVGYPIWFREAPAFVLDYVSKLDLRGKTVIPFCTSGRSGIKGSLPGLAEAAEGAEIKFPYSAGLLSRDNFNEWLQKVRDGFLTSSK